MKRVFLLILTIISLSLPTHAQFHINGLTVVNDSRTGTFLCSVPDSVFGTNFQAKITLDKDWDEIILGGEMHINGDIMEFGTIEGGKQWTVKLVGDSTIHGTLTFTSLPILELEGTFGYEYAPGLVRLLMPGEITSQWLTAKLKWRGGTTNTDGKHKRNFHIKFIDEQGLKQDQSFFGLREDNSWILDAGQVDMGRVRNRVATELWLDMAQKPYYIGSEKKALSGVRGEMVEVMLNGSYNGIYAFTEALDRKQVKIKKYKEDSIGTTVRGQLWKAVSWSRSVNMFTPASYNNNLDTWDGFELKYPELEEVSPTDWSVLYNAAKWLSNSSISSFNEHAAEYFDMPVYIDYIIFTDVLNAIDNLAKNQYWFCYDRTDNKRLSIAVWDLDTTVGQNWTDDPLHPETVSPTRPALHNTHALTYKATNPNSIYYPILQKRYNELRHTWLHADSLKQRYARRINALIASGAAAREEQRWSGDTDIARNQLNFAAELEYIFQWIDKRMDYLDQNAYERLIQGDVNNDGEVGVSDVTALVSILMDHSPQKPMQLLRADVNNDGEVGISDITSLTHIILTQNNDEP